MKSSMVIKISILLFLCSCGNHSVSKEIVEQYQETFNSKMKQYSLTNDTTMIPQIIACCDSLMSVIDKQDKRYYSYFHTKNIMLAEQGHLENALENEIKYYSNKTECVYKAKYYNLIALKYQLANNRQIADRYYKNAIAEYKKSPMTENVVVQIVNCYMMMNMDDAAKQLLLDSKKKYSSKALGYMYDNYDNLKTEALAAALKMK